MIEKTNLQKVTVLQTNAVEIEHAASEIRELLSGLYYIDTPLWIAERFVDKGDKGQGFYFPETFAPEKPGSQNYKRLTPDADLKGSFFFIVGDGKPSTFEVRKNKIDYSLGIIFSVNLEKIDAAKLQNGLFTQELLRDARTLLSANYFSFDFDFKIESETRDLKRVFQEFTIDELKGYNRAPMQCFRLNLTVTIDENC